MTTGLMAIILSLIYVITFFFASLNRLKVF